MDTAVKLCVGAILFACLFYLSYNAEAALEAETDTRDASSLRGLHTTEKPKSQHYQITAQTKQRLLSERATPASDLIASEGLRCRGVEENSRDASQTTLRGCCACRDAAVEMLFNECGHVCMCELCVVLAAGGLRAEEDVDVVLRCPQCRKSGTLRRVYCS